MDLYDVLKERKILLVEGDPWVGDSLARFLRDKGCRVVAQHGTAPGAFVADTDRFDIVICGHQPPWLEGLACLALARRALPDAILVLLTEDDAEDVRPEAERAGIDEIIGKPFDVKDVERSLHRVLDRRSGGQGRGMPPSG